MWRDSRIGGSLQNRDVDDNLRSVYDHRRNGTSNDRNRTLSSRETREGQVDVSDSPAFRPHASLADVWVCPHCHGPLVDARCEACARAFPRENEQIDFRPTSPLVLEMSWRYDPEFGEFPWDRMRLEWPSLDNGVERTDADEVVERSMLGSAPRGSGLALDIGCGETRQRFRTGFASLGYTPIGVDIAGSAPDALADAHLLPLPDDSVDLVMTSAVWEHLKNPHRALSEVARVAKPGAHFVGSVAFSEPYHTSYFHHSPLAVYELLTANDFEADYFVLVDRYSAFRAHMMMGTAGRRLPRSLRGPVGDLFWWLAIGPSMLKGTAEIARRHFARSHAAAVGFSARKR
jgi:SAM-dependent methyltransferase